MPTNENTKTLGITLFSGAVGAAAAAITTAVAGIRSFDGLPDLNFDEHEISEIDQVSLIKQWAMGHADGGSLSPRLSMTNARLTTLYALYDGKDRSWKMVFPMKTGNTVAAILHFEGPLKRI